MTEKWYRGMFDRPVDDADVPIIFYGVFIFVSTIAFSRQLIEERWLMLGIGALFAIVLLTIIIGEARMFFNQ